jgi:hypothetical protein
MGSRGSQVLGVRSSDSSQNVKNFHYIVLKINFLLPRDLRSRGE